MLGFILLIVVFIIVANIQNWSDKQMYRQRKPNSKR
jgi:hypothetical protein